MTGSGHCHGNALIPVVVGLVVGVCCGGVGWLVWVLGFFEIFFGQGLDIWVGLVES